MGEIREPIRKSSIEKKQKIILRGFELMCEQGYHNTDTIEIAKAAEVSTGIIYQYFKDKKDIFVQGLKHYYASVTGPIFEEIERTKIETKNLDKVVGRVIDIFIENHQISAKAHREIDAMEYSDDEIGQIFLDQETEITRRIVMILERSHFVTSNLQEKVHLIYGLIDHFAHEVVYHQHIDYNYDAMREEVIKIIMSMLSTN